MVNRIDKSELYSLLILKYFLKHPYILIYDSSSFPTIKRMKGTAGCVWEKIGMSVVGKGAGGKVFLDEMSKLTKQIEANKREGKKDFWTKNKIIFLLWIKTQRISNSFLAQLYKNLVLPQRLFVKHKRFFWKTKFLGWVDQIEENNIEIRTF